MDEFQDDYGAEEEIVEDADIEMGVSIEAEEETADLIKLFRQHPEIWIPFEEQVLEQLNVKAPGEKTIPSLSVRDYSILDAKHSTYPFLTNYEKTKCISYRASQLANGAKPYVLVPEGVTDTYSIAKMELEAKRLPFIVKRPLPDGSFEVWRLSDLLIL